MTGQITPCVGGVILDEQGRVLLVKHVPEKKGFWSGKYICPGGRLEYGETLDDGVRREIREETGLEIRILRWLAPLERIIQNPDGSIADHVIYLDVLAQLDKGKFTPSSDVGEGDWFSPQELQSIKSQIHEDTQSLLRNVDLLR